MKREIFNNVFNKRLSNQARVIIYINRGVFPLFFFSENLSMMSTPKRTPMTTRRTRQQQQQEPMAVVSPPPVNPPNFTLPTVQPKEMDFTFLTQGCMKPSDSFAKVGVQFSPNPKNPSVMYGSFRQGVQEIKLLLENVKTKGFNQQEIKDKDNNNKVLFTRHAMSVQLSDAQYSWLQHMTQTFAEQFATMLPVHLGKEFQQTDSPLFTFEDLKFLRTQPGKETVGVDGKHYYQDVKFFIPQQLVGSTSRALEDLPAFFLPGTRSVIDILLRPYVKINTKNNNYFSFGFGIKAIQSNYMTPVTQHPDSFTIPFNNQEDEEMEGEPLM